MSDNEEKLVRTAFRFGAVRRAEVAAGAAAAASARALRPAVSACVAGRATGGVCEIANDNAPGQLVLSGSRAAIDAACEHGRGARQDDPLGCRRCHRNRHLALASALLFVISDCSFDGIFSQD